MTEYKKRHIEFRTLKADEIEVRVQSVKDGKANMLLYIDSRAVTRILDEHLGNLNWQSEFYEVNGQTMGKISIYDEERNIWVSKSDTGSESNIEAEKGLISDIYKRILSRFGIMELYSSPKIVIDDDGYGNKGYKVSHIEYNDNRQIVSLKIVNRFNKEVFVWCEGKEIPTEYKVKAVAEIDFQQALTDYCTALKNNGFDKNEILKFFNYYKSAIEKGWRGREFNAEKLWINWNKKVA